MFRQQQTEVTIADLILPLSFFQQQEPAYALPEGAIGVEYVRHSHHILFYPDAAVGGGLPWVDGDRYLSKVAVYRAAWTAAQVTAPSVAALPQWQQLKTALRGSELFGIAFSTTNLNAWALLLNALDSNEPAEDPGRLADFQFAIAQIRAGLAVDYTPEQVNRFNQLLASAGFSIAIA